MKRALCLLLAVALLFGCTAMLDVRAFAASNLEIEFDELKGNSSQTLITELNFDLPEFQVGEPIPAAQNITVTVEGADVELVKGFMDVTNNTPISGGVFENGNHYWLVVSIVPKAGTAFGDNVSVSCEGREYVWGMNDAQNGLQFDFKYEFRSDSAVMGLSLSGLPEEIAAGQTEVPNVSCDGGATVTQTRWVDKNKNPVTALAEGGEYYLEVRLTAWEGYCFGDYVDIWNIEMMDDYQIVDDKTLVYYRYYSLLPDAGELFVHISGLELGAPISGVSAQVTGNATLGYALVYEQGSWDPITQGNFQPGKLYQISIALRPAQGYRFGNDTGLESDPPCYGWSTDSDGVYYSVYFSTLEKIETVELTMSGAVADGKKVTDAVVTAPADANYTLEDYSWYDQTDHAVVTDGKFMTGHEYLLQANLVTKEGYGFPDNLRITLNGKTVQFGKDAEGLTAYVYEVFSLEKKITKVELPAMPKSVKKGATLKTGFKVSSSAKYTLTARWINALTGEQVTKAEEDGVYLLAFVAEPKKGYQFADNVPLYVDGKKTLSAMQSPDYIQVYKSYSVGVPTISRIDLTLDLPKDGQAPGAVAIPADANYELLMYLWSRGTEVNIYDVDTDFAVFEDGWYHFLALEVRAKEGYTLSGNTAVYINGQKYATIAQIDGGPEQLIGLNMGKLGLPMKAPSVKKLTDEETGKYYLSWAEDPQAEGYEVYRATKKSGKYTLVATVTEPAFRDTEAPAGKTYYYKVKAISVSRPGRNSGLSSAVSMDIKCDTPVVEATNAPSGKPKLSWEKVTGAKQYTVYRASSETGKYSKLGTTKSASYEDKKAGAGKTYFYKVIANGSASKYNSGYSAIVSANVICGTPSVTVKIDVASGKPSLSWKKVDQAAGYVIYRDGEALVTVTTTSYLDTTAAIDTQYTYAVQTLGKTEELNGEVSKTVTATSGIAQPKLSSGVNADGKPHFSWQPIEGAVKYEVYRSTKSSKGYTLLATVEEVNAYVDETVAGGKTFYYKVKAVGEVSSSESSYVKLTGKCAAPQISVALHETSGKPVLSWEKVSGAKKYTVYRATSEDGKYTKLGTTTKLSYTDSKAKPGTEYFYKVIANGSKSSYNSIYSNVAVTIGYAAKPQVTLKNDSKGKPVVSWKKISEAEKYMVVYVDITDVEKEEDLTENFILENMQYVEVSKKKTSATLSQAQTGRIYMVVVVAVPKNEEFSGASLPGYVASTCAAPKISGKYIQGYNCGTWKAVEGAQFYAVYRSTKKSSGYQLIGTVDNDSSFADLSAVKGKTYYYKVTACTQYTESAMSNYIKLKTK